MIPRGVVVLMHDEQKVKSKKYCSWFITKLSMLFVGHRRVHDVVCAGE